MNNSPVMRKKLIIIPYAYGGNTGCSIQNETKQFDTYMKNVCVAASSAVRNSGPDTDIMVVSNIELSEPYQSLIKGFDIKFQLCPFNRFNFGSETADGKIVSWQLAFYKLCALAYCVANFDYSHICFMDTDVFVQNSFEPIWREADKNILLYDICAPSDGYMVKEMQEYLETDECLTHFGGEFFAASSELAVDFIVECEDVFSDMLSSGYVTTSGDEFITSIVAHRMKHKVKNAGAYIRRYWTGSYRLVCDDYKHRNIIVLHMPAEKEQGIISLYNRFVRKRIVPKKELVWRRCHLNHRGLRVRVGVFARRLGLVK